MERKPNKVLIENGVVVGNVTKKKNSTNPIAKHLVNQFDKRIRDIFTEVNPSRILEVGCGEGEVVKLALETTKATILATDISDHVISNAQSNIQSDRVNYENISIYDIPATDRYKADLVVCCEVLEHLEDPQAGLDKLAELTTSDCLLSVPLEPLWRAMNMARLSYLGDWGNTPGHLQHWSKAGFISFVSTRFVVKKVYSPIPWTVILCQKK